ncbi:hypothetical protein CsSME_00021768 [Camellia sinensis var. sinensis]
MAPSLIVASTGNCAVRMVFNLISPCRLIHRAMVKLKPPTKPSWTASRRGWKKLKADGSKNCRVCCGLTALRRGDALGKRRLFYTLEPRQSFPWRSASQP